MVQVVTLEGWYHGIHAAFRQAVGISLASFLQLSQPFNRLVG